MERSLEIPEAQVAIDFFDDENGFNFHVRVLLVPAGAGKWLWITLDCAVQFGDLTAHRVAIREQAVALAAVLGIEVPRGAAAAPPRWGAADPAHLQFGQVLDAAISGDEDRFVRRGAVALAMLDTDDDEGSFAVCENVREERHQQWLDEKRSGGPRRATFDQAIGSRRPQTAEDWVFRGPKSLLEFLTSVRASGLGIAGYANRCITSRGIPPGSGAAHEIRLLLEALRHFIECGQVDVANLAGAGLLVAMGSFGGRCSLVFRFVSKAFRELLKSSNIYSEEGRLTVRPFVQGKVSLLQVSVEPRGAFDFVSDRVRQVLLAPERFLERHSDEFSDQPRIEPCWDPLLNPRVRANRPRLLAQLRRLADMGVVVATRREKAIVGLFFVDRKGDRLRVIVGGRQPNQFHRLPPQTSMASVEALASVQVWADRRLRCSVCAIPHLSDWFVFDVPGARAVDLVAQQVYDGDAGTFVEAAPGDYVWRANGGQALGWSWALWICRETLARVMRSSAGPRDVMVLDTATAARMGRGRVGAPPCVDNANIIGVERDLAQARLERMTAALDLLGLKWRERQDAGVEVEILGVIVDGVQGRVRAEPKRPWRLYGGRTFLLKWRKAAGWQVRAVLGRLVSFYQLLRPGPSVFRILYEVAQRDLGEIRELPTAPLRELRVARSLLFLAVGRLGLPPCPVAFMTGASMKGYALPGTDATPDEVHDLCRCRERARSSMREKFVERERDGCGGSLAIGDSGEGWRGGVLERARPRGPAPGRCRVEVDSGWRPPPLPDVFVGPKRWELVVVRCGLMGLARAASYTPYRGAELLSAGGDVGSVLAFEKGLSQWRPWDYGVRGLGVCGCDPKNHSHGLCGCSSTIHESSDSRDPIEVSGLHQDLYEALLAEFSGASGISSHVGERSRRGRRFFLEVFSGEGYLTGAILEMGLRAGVPVDREKGPHFDIADPKVQKECRRAGVHLALESPQLSRLWAWRPLVRALRSASATIVDLCQRRSGAPFQRPTRIAASHPLFAALGRECRCRRRCEVLQGKVCVEGHWVWKTSLAAAYPPSVCRVYAGVARLLAPLAAARPSGGAELERRWERQLAASRGCDAVGVGAGARAGGRAWQARAEPRGQALGFPRRSTVRQATAARYSDCVEELSGYIARSGGSLADPGAADSALERHFVALILGGEAKADARWCLCGLAWGPAVWEAALAVACDLIGRDLQSTLAGALLLVGVDGYLRPCEALGLRGADVLRPPRSSPQRLWAAAVAPATQPVPSKTNAFDETIFLGSAATRRPRGTGFQGQGFVGNILDALLARAGQGPQFGGLALAQLEAIASKACRRLVGRGGRGASRGAPEKLQDLRGIQRRGRWEVGGASVDQDGSESTDAAGERNSPSSMRARGQPKFGVLYWGGNKESRGWEFEGSGGSIPKTCRACEGVTETWRGRMDNMHVTLRQCASEGPGFKRYMRHFMALSPAGSAEYNLHKFHNYNRNMKKKVLTEQTVLGNLLVRAKRGIGPECGIHARSSAGAAAPSWATLLRRRARRYRKQALQEGGHFAAVVLEGGEDVLHMGRVVRAVDEAAERAEGCRIKRLLVVLGGPDGISENTREGAEPDGAMMPAGAAAPVIAFAVVLFTMRDLLLKPLTEQPTKLNSDRGLDADANHIPPVKSELTTSAIRYISALYRRVDEQDVAVQQRPPDAAVGRVVLGERTPDQPVNKKSRVNDELIDKVSGMAQRIKTTEQKKCNAALHPPSEAHKDNKEALQALAVEIADLRRRLDLIPESGYVTSDADASLSLQNVHDVKKLNSNRIMVQKHAQYAHVGSSMEHDNFLIDNVCSESFPDASVLVKRVVDMKKLNSITDKKKPNIINNSTKRISNHIHNHHHKNTKRSNTYTNSCHSKLMEKLENDTCMGSNADYVDTLNASIRAEYCLDSFAKLLGIYVDTSIQVDDALL
ncbi:unnamed protein product [Prorocentrum cordatum]|uniref:Uncharacterized protein n=1 Tax=Prorocentrum cordatum TaxID=2364126 RepID=A0ABN9VL38_9DINO|nr:unnamed protein product [Polarella glacialis]